MHRALQGRCGLFCGDCEIYIAYSTEDTNKQQKIAKATGKVKGRDILPDQVKCLGCKGSMASVWRTSCAIRACAEERGLEFCYQCQNFACDKLQKFFERHSEARDNLRKISKIGPDAWLHFMLTRNGPSEDADG